MALARLTQTVPAMDCGANLRRIRAKAEMRLRRIRAKAEMKPMPHAVTGRLFQSNPIRD